MKSTPIFAALLIMLFPLAACGGGQSGQSQETGQSASGGSTQERSTPGSTSASSPEQEAERANRQDGQQDGSGYSVTILDGEQVGIGAGDNVTVLFFMAGW